MMRFVNETEEENDNEVTNAATNDTTGIDLDYEHLNQGQEFLIFKLNKFWAKYRYFFNFVIFNFNMMALAIKV